MKNFIFFIVLILTGNLTAFGQAFMYKHVATDANIVASLTRLDHPMLNDNPDAKLIVTHNWGDDTVYNDHVTSAFYNTATGVWFLRNEDIAPMIENATFNIYIAQDNEIITHIATEENQGTGPNISLIDYPPLVGNDITPVFLTHSYNPNYIQNDINYGLYFNSIADRRGIFSEGGQVIPDGAAFFLLVGTEGENVAFHRHQATAATITANYSELDHPFLNGNPDAIFIVQHYFGAMPDSNVNNDHTVGVWFRQSTQRWNIFNEDLADFPEGIVFDLAILNPNMGLEEQSLAKVKFFPNPTDGVVTFSSKEILESIEIYDLAGKKIIGLLGNTTELQADLSYYPKGTYLAVIQTSKGKQTLKVVKN